MKPEINAKETARIMETWKLIDILLKTRHKLVSRITEWHESSITEPMVYYEHSAKRKSYSCECSFIFYKNGENSYPKLIQRSELWRSRQRTLKLRLKKMIQKSVNQRDCPSREYNKIEKAI